MSDISGKRKIMGVTVAVALFAVLAVGIVVVDWNDYTGSDVPIEQPTFPTDDTDSIWDEDGELRQDSLAYVVFEKYGLVLFPLALLMFGAMVGGVVISREEAEIDDSD